jgi:hypothetical protein
MACPYFHPASNEVTHMPGWHPLGDAYRGTCQANPQEPFVPDEATLRHLCNLGYAGGTCARFPRDTAVDAVRFTVTCDVDGSIGLAYVAEKNHLPQSHGVLQYSRATGAFTSPGADAVILRLADAYLASYLRRKAHAA